MFRVALTLYDLGTGRFLWDVLAFHGVHPWGLVPLEQIQQISL